METDYTACFTLDTHDHVAVFAPTATEVTHTVRRLAALGWEPVDPDQAPIPVLHHYPGAHSPEFFLTLQRPTIGGRPLYVSAADREFEQTIWLPGAGLSELRTIS